jgi:hypothetical protein
MMMTARRRPRLFWIAALATTSTTTTAVAGSSSSVGPKVLRSFGTTTSSSNRKGLAFHQLTPAPSKRGAVSASNSLWKQTHTSFLRRGGGGVGYGALTTTHHRASTTTDANSGEDESLKNNATNDGNNGQIPSDEKGTSSLLVYDDDTVKDMTLAWLKRVVIGMNLCPFADRPFRDGQVKIDVVRGNDEHDLLALLLAELMIRTDIPGTTLMVCPDLYPDNFDQFWQVVQSVEQGLMVEHDELEGVVQMAPFHPLFQFEGSSGSSDNNEEEDPGDWTNRSPFPIFHILREEEVTKAVDKIDGDASRVWIRNVDLLDTLAKKLGRESFQNVMRGQGNISNEDASTVKSTLREFRIQMEQGGNKSTDRNDDT